MPYPIEDAVPFDAIAGATAGTTAVEDRAPHGPPPDRPLPGAPAGEPQIPRRKGLWFTLASAAALVVLAPTAGQVYGWIFRQSSSSTWSEAHPVTAVRVNVASGDVQIDPGAAGEARVRDSLSWVRHKPSVQESWDGDSLVVTVACDGGGFLLPDECSANLEITVPASASVTVTASSGNVSATGMSGSVRMATDSGDIQLTGVGGAVYAHAISGSVSGQNLTATAVDVQADSGDVDLEFATAPQRVVSRVISGDTTILVPRDGGYLITGQTAAGGRNIDQALVNEQSTRAISVDSDSGDVDVHGEG
jgi:DUF4097 and DUF4098 domain-containing protein YvlB